MQQKTYHEWLFEQLQPLMQEGKFEKAEALLEEQNSLSFISRDTKKVLDNMDGILYSSKRLYKADLAMKAGQWDEATAILEDIENDEKIPRQGKSAARRMMFHIEKRQKYLDEIKGKRP